MRLVQFKTAGGSRKVGLVSQDGLLLQVLQEATSAYELAMRATESKLGLERLVMDHVSKETVDYDGVVSEGRLLPPIDHPDPAHCYVGGTGLNHLSSAVARKAMHSELGREPSTLSDPMKLFKLGLEGGKPEKGKVGVQPWWFYRGDGDCIVPPGYPLQIPPFGLDGGEEAEIVGLYVIGRSGTVFRVGFALGNEFSDHVLERQNYLYLAHSKLRSCSMGPELLIGKLPDSVSGSVVVLRGDVEIWRDRFLTGEANMSHSIANMEHHYFKYPAFRRPGDLHCQFFGAATLSFSAGIVTKPGDVFEISATPFGRTLRNPLIAAKADGGLTEVKAL